MTECLLSGIYHVTSQHVIMDFKYIIYACCIFCDATLVLIVLMKYIIHMHDNVISVLHVKSKWSFKTISLSSKRRMQNTHAGSVGY